MAAAFYNQTNSLSFAFIPRERSEWTQCYSSAKRNQAIATRWSSLRSKSRRWHPIIIPAAWYLRKSLSLWYDLELFLVLLQLAAVTGLLKRLGLSPIPLKERAEYYKSRFLASYSFSRAWILLPWQRNKNRKMHWTEKSEKPPSLLTKTENRIL